MDTKVASSIERLVQRSYVSFSLTFSLYRSRKIPELVMGLGEVEALLVTDNFMG